MDFFHRYKDRIFSYAKACPVALVIFMACAIITDEYAAWLVAHVMIYVTFVACLFAQFTQNITEGKKNKKIETETEKHI